MKPGEAPPRAGPATRRLSAGVDTLPGGGAHARVWAPACRRVDIALKTGSGEAVTVPLHAHGEGFFSADLPQARAGDRYLFELDGERRRPDPVSRYQPEGPHGPSEIIDPSTFRWTDDGWTGVGPEGQAIYEMHIGTFTREGTWAAAARELPARGERGLTRMVMLTLAALDGRVGGG